MKRSQLSRSTKAIPKHAEASWQQAVVTLSMFQDDCPLPRQTYCNTLRACATRSVLMSSRIST